MSLHKIVREPKAWELRVRSAKSLLGRTARDKVMFRLSRSRASSHDVVAKSMLAWPTSGHGKFSPQALYWA